MASKQEYVDYILEQIDNSGEIICKKMFGEHGIYCNGTFFGMICDDKFFIKPTEGGKSFMELYDLAPAYPGAKPSILIDERIEDQNWISQLIRITVAELPKPRPKKKKK